MYVRPKKALGQHFLHDSAIARRIVQALLSHWPLPMDKAEALLAAEEGTVAAEEAGVSCVDADTCSLWPVVEVGPGTGVLTALLLQEPGLNYHAVELDREAVEFLHKTHPQLGERLLLGDFLKLPTNTFPERFALIGNFPYNISSQIFFRVLDLKDRIPLVVGMLQKEVAERFCSPPGNRAYGILSVLLQTWYRPEYLFSVAPGAFTPPPKVQSGVIRLTRNNRTALDCPEDLYLKVIKTAFNQRRKMLSNSLKPLLKDLPRNGAQQDNTSIDGLHRRPEQLSVEDFIALTTQIATL